jgi:hypothetical protein
MAGHSPRPDLKKVRLNRRLPLLSIPGTLQVRVRYAMLGVCKERRHPLPKCQILVREVAGGQSPKAV